MNRFRLRVLRMKIKQKIFNEQFSKPSLYSFDSTHYILNILKDYEFQSLLEIGCGNGRNLDMINKKFHNKKLNGIDISDVGVKVAQKNNLNAVHGSADNLPYDNNSFDIVLTVHALEQMKYIIDDVIKEMYRVCRNKVVSFEPVFELQNIFGRIHNFTHDYVKGLPFLFEKHGFEIEEFKKLGVGGFKNRTCLIVGNKLNIKSKKQR